MAIISRETIARLADHAARKWAGNPEGRKPESPFDPITQPEHHREWKAAFERFLVLHSAPDAEASA